MQPPKEIREAARELDRAAREKTGRDYFEFRGNSMLPFFREGDRLCIEPVKIQELCIGDVAVYSGREIFVVHRFLYRSKHGHPGVYFVAKADNASRRDAPVPSGSLVGRVKMLTRGDTQIYFDRLPPKAINFLAGVVSLTEVAVLKGYYVSARLFLKDLSMRNVYRGGFGRSVGKVREVLLKLLDVFLKG